ncbi:hypothetical protein TRSC58_07297 [Trypanosoma rangeli SC58]|uniref:Uncharacterized protein n=1 Tax=Trypanosoma rangeli SC58 TaxID=429131 RepID=A0A061IRQ2_TRYRA|nr:hypothetical protein TRSC58_07297 [Trypanosoma rangeli SC58]
MLYFLPFCVIFFFLLFHLGCSFFFSSFHSFLLTRTRARHPDACDGQFLIFFYICTRFRVQARRHGRGSSGVSVH